MSRPQSCEPPARRDVANDSESVNRCLTMTIAATAATVTTTPGQESGSRTRHGVTFAPARQRRAGQRCVHREAARMAGSSMIP